METNTDEKTAPAPAPTATYWTDWQVARELQVTVRTVQNFRARRIIPFIKIGRVVRFDRAAVRAALARQTVQARP